MTFIESGPIYLLDTRRGNLVGFPVPLCKGERMREKPTIELRE